LAREVIERGTVIGTNNPIAEHFGEVAGRNVYAPTW